MGGLKSLVGYRLLFLGALGYSLGCWLYMFWLLGIWPGGIQNLGGCCSWCGSIFCRLWMLMMCFMSLKASRDTWESTGACFWNSFLRENLEGYAAFGFWKLRTPVERMFFRLFT